MKTTKLILIIFALVYSLQISAQIKVASTGRVDISGQTAIVGSIYSDVLDVKNNASTLPQGYDLIWGYYSSNQPNNPGLLSLQSANGAYFTVRANGAVGINRSPSSPYLLDVNGSIRVGTVTYPSDERLKSNISKMGNSFSKLNKLNGITYKLNSNFAAKEGNVSKNSPFISSKDSLIQKQVIDTSFFNRTRYGLSAQEVQKYFPELVYTDKEGMLSVDYISLIPILLESIKELNTRISSYSDLEKDLQETKSKLLALEQKLNDCCPNSKSTSEISNDANVFKIPILYQNVPNPFTQDTEIRYYLPESVKNGVIYIYDMQGLQITSKPINNRGNGNIKIYGNELKAGMYIYTLIVDGKEVETKRMILTK